MDFKMLAYHDAHLLYRWLGVDHVYLSENAASPTSALRAELDSFVKSGFLTYTTEPMPRSQLKAYYDCMTQNYDKHNWLAFFDIDEFLILMPGHAPPPATTAMRHLPFPPIHEQYIYTDRMCCKLNV